MDAADSATDGVTFSPVKFSHQSSHWNSVIRYGGYVLAGATLVAISVAFPPVLMVCIALAHLLIGGVLIGAAFFGKHWVRGFAMGAVVPNLIASLAMVPFALHGDPIFFGIMVVGFLSTILIGSTSAVTQKYLVSRGGKVAVPRWIQKFVDTGE